MSGFNFITIPGGYSQLLLEYFLNRFIRVDDRFFRFIPSETHNQPWMFTCSIIQYGNIQDRWIIEFDIYYNSDNLLYSFTFDGYLPYLYDNFMEEIKKVNDEYTISCDNCYTYVTIEFSEENPICPNCGYGLNIKGKPNFYIEEQDNEYGIDYYQPYDNEVGDNGLTTREEGCDDCNKFLSEFLHYGMKYCPICHRRLM